MRGADPATPRRLARLVNTIYGKDPTPPKGLNKIYRRGPDCISRNVFEGLKFEIRKFGIFRKFRRKPETEMENPEFFLLVHPTGTHTELMELI